MLSKKESKKRFDDLLEVERETNIERVMWLSFCDPSKAAGSQFLGVIVTKALGLSDAILKTHAKGINPSGQVMSYILDDDEIKPEHYDQLLTADQLIKYGYVYAK